MHQNAQFEEHLTLHREHLNNANILPEKERHSPTPEELSGSIATTTKIQLRPHDGIISYPTTTSTELEDKKHLKRCLNRKQYTQNSCISY